jgi:ribonuclease HII
MRDVFDMALKPKWPSLEKEQELWARGLVTVAGVDEAGRGALAGPVYAAAVILPNRKRIELELLGVRDSKMMHAEEREYWAPIVQAKAVAWGIGHSTRKEIDRFGIAPASRMAARRAVEALGALPEHLLVDYLALDGMDCAQTALIAGDARCLSIAAASVLAKTARDEVLRKLDRRYPQYGFAAHKGYATEEHREAIKVHGPCPQHRRSFAPVREHDGLQTSFL